VFDGLSAIEYNVIIFAMSCFLSKRNCVLHLAGSGDIPLSILLYLLERKSTRYITSYSELVLTTSHFDFNGLCLQVLHQIARSPQSDLP